MSSTTICDRLKRIHGLDADAALRGLGGHVGTLDRVMRTFALTYADGLPALVVDDPSDDDRSNRSRGVCHSVKGALSAIGARRVGAMALHLEGELRAGRSCRELFAKRQRLHEEVLTLAGQVTLAIHSRESSDFLGFETFGAKVGAASPTGQGGSHSIPAAQ